MSCIGRNRCQMRDRRIRILRDPRKYPRMDQGRRRPGLGLLAWFGDFVVGERVVKIVKMVKYLRRLESCYRSCRGQRWTREIVGQRRQE